MKNKQNIGYIFLCILLSNSVITTYSNIIQPNNNVNFLQIKENEHLKVNTQNKFACLGLCLAAAIASGVRVAWVGGKAIYNEAQRRKGEERAMEQLKILDKAPEIIKQAHQFSLMKENDQNDKKNTTNVCEDGAMKYKYGQTIFGMIMVLTDAYEMLRNMGCYCVLKNNGEECAEPYRLKKACPKKKLFKKLQKLYTPALQTFQTLQLEDWKQNIPEEKEIVESIVDSGIQTAEKSLDNLVHKAVVRSAEGSSLIDFSQLHHTANMAGKTMELLSHVDPRAAADAVSITVSLVSTIYGFSKKTSGYDQLEDNEKAQDQVDTMKAITTGARITTAVVGAMVGLPSSYFFLVGEFINQGVSQIDEQRERQTWVTQFAPALEKAIEEKGLEKLIKLKFGKKKCGKILDEEMLKSKKDEINKLVQSDRRR
eukprot:g2226.t1